MGMNNFFRSFAFEILNNIFSVMDLGSFCYGISALVLRLQRMFIQCSPHWFPA